MGLQNIAWICTCIGCVCVGLRGVVFCVCECGRVDCKIGNKICAHCFVEEISLPEPTLIIVPPAVAMATK